MTKNFAAKRMQLGLATWASETTNPGAGAGTAANIGSWWQRPGNGGTTPTELYLKTSSVDTGWTHQNLFNLNIFNVKDYGAVGDGITNDTTSIQNAVNAASAAGGGIVYFPPTTAFYSIVKHGALDIIDFSGLSNVTLLGDGYATKIRQTGSCGGGETHMFGVRNNASRIRFVNFYYDNNGITNADPARQNHGIEVYSTTAAGIAPTDVEILGCYTGYFVGDAVRFIGTANKILTNVKIQQCAFDVTVAGVGARSAISVQRNTQDIQIHYNWILGAHGNAIDFEPTSTVPPDADAPAYYSIIGNLFDNFNQLVDTITLSRSWLLTVAYNIINNGTSISGVNTWSSDIRGNILDWGGDNTQYGIDFQSTCKHLRICFNIINIPTQTNNRRGISIQSGSGGVAPFTDLVFGNIVRCPVVTSQGGIENDATWGITVGNLIDMHVASGDNGYGITTGGPTVAAGNMIAASGARLDKAIACITGGGDNEGDSMIHNVFVGTIKRGCQFNTPGPYPNGMACGNTGWGVATLFINNEAGTTTQPFNTDGNAGPGSKIAEIPLAAGPSGLLVAGIGSLCTSTLANQNQTFFYKESGLPTENTIWVSYGEVDIAMGALLGDAAATADRFMAPGGMALAVESAVEIQFAVVRACIFRNLRMRCAAGTGGGNNTFRVRKNGVDTALQFTVANTATTGSDTTNSFTAVAGDLISVRDTKTALPATAQARIQISLGCI